MDAGPPACPRCGTPPEDRYQEYCLECGSRLFRYPAARSSLFRREAWAGQSPLWMWLPLLALLLLALLLTGVVVWAASDEDEPKREARPTSSAGISIVTGPTTIAPPVSTFTSTTLPTTTFATTTIPTTTAPTTTAASTDVIAWPPRNRGYTIVLASVPKDRGRNAADRKANEAIDRGLSEVGVLDSSQYTSLTPGYYVVFTGVYDTEQEAENGLSGARAANYPLAYVREVRP